MDGIVVYDLQIYGHIEEWVSLAPYYVVELNESVPTRHQVLDLEGTRVVSRRRWIQAGIRLVLHILPDRIIWVLQLRLVTHRGSWVIFVLREHPRIGTLRTVRATGDRCGTVENCVRVL